MHLIVVYLLLQMQLLQCKDAIRPIVLPHLQMLAFLKRCESQMQRLLQTHLSRDAHSTPTSSKTLLNSPSLLKRLSPW